MRFRLRISPLRGARLLCALLMQAWWPMLLSAQTLTGGTMDGSFSTGSTGNASWKLDLTLPPGTHNVQPQLAIAYSSSGGNGIMGQGFSLSGLSAINRTGATWQQDGYRAGVQYAATDRFSLSGSRLMMVSGSAYGASGTVYYTENDKYARIVSNGVSGSGPQSFTITTKLGNTVTYGGTSDSRVLASGARFQSGSLQGSVRQWLVNQYTDLNGNSINFQYTSSPTTVSGGAIAGTQNKSQAYLKSISWTSNAAQGLQPQRFIYFYYEARPDTVATFQAGAVGQVMARLSLMKVCVVQPNGDTVVSQTFQFNYYAAQGVAPSRIQSIVQTGNDGTQLPATTFTWTPGPNGFAQKTPSAYPVSGTSRWQGDFNGDGLTDALSASNTSLNTLWLANGSGFNSTPISPSILLKNFTYTSDFTGDGLADIFTTSYSGGLIYPGTRNGISQSTIPTSGYSIQSNCNSCTWTGDFNGDGLTDYYVKGASSGSMMINNTKGFNSAISVSNTSVNTSLGYTVAGDFNGDGLDDLYVIGSTSGTIYYSNFSQGSGFLSGVPVTNIAMNSPTSSPPWVADFNGDELPDLFYLYGSYWYLALCNGNGFNTPLNLGSMSFNKASTWPGDFNGDGLTDLYSVISNNGTLFLSNGKGFTQQPSSGLNFVANNTWLGDFNGDGIADLFNNSGNTLYLSANTQSTNLSQNQKANLVATINNGSGGITTVNYAPLTSAAVYDEDEAPDGQSQLTLVNPFNNNPLNPTLPPGKPYTLFDGASYVVAAYSQTDGRGNRYPYGCFYETALFDRLGYGFLGYRSVTVADTNAGNKSVTLYHQFFPLTGQQDTTFKMDLNNRILGRSRTYYSVSFAQGNGGPGTVFRVNTIRSRSDFFNYGVYEFTTGTDSKNDQWGNDTLLVIYGDTTEPKNTVYARVAYLNSSSPWMAGYPLSNHLSATASGADTLLMFKYQYSPQMNRTGSSWWDNSNHNWVDSTWTYDGFGNMRKAVYPAGDSTNYTYDNFYHTFVATETSPPNQQGQRLTTQYQYEPLLGNLSTVTDANGNQMSTQYDGFGRSKAVLMDDSTGTLKAISQYVYQPQSVGYTMQKMSLLSWSKPMWDTSMAWYDGMQRNYQNTQRGWGAKPVTQTTAFNGDNKVISKSQPYFNGDPVYATITHYDAYGRPDSMWSPGSSGSQQVLTTLQYNKKQAVVTTAAGTAQATSMTTNWDLFNSQKRMTQSIYPGGNGVTLNYDVLGNLVAVHQPDGNWDSLAYNSMMRSVYIANNSMGAVRTVYNDETRTEASTDAEGETVTTLSDGLNRPVLRYSSTGDSSAFIYDQPGMANGLGQVTTSWSNGPTGRITEQFTYDRAGNVASATVIAQGASFTQLQSFNPNTSANTITYPDGSVASFSYTAQGLLNAVTFRDGLVAGAAWTTPFAAQGYDASERLLQEQLGNGTMSQFSYLPSHMLGSWNVKSPTGNYLANEQYSWNALHQATSVTDAVNSSWSQQFSFDAQGQLDTAWGGYGTHTFGYDAAGNLVSKNGIVFEYDGYQVLSGVKNGDTVFKASYTASGNLQWRELNVRGKNVRSTFGFNAFNQLEQAQTGKLSALFGYDSDGRRVVKKESGTGTTVIYVSPQFEVTQTGSGVLYTRYVQGWQSAVCALTAVKSGSPKKLKGSTVYYHSNALNSTTLTTDASGNVGTRAGYDPWGNVWSFTGPDNFRYKFGGKELDALTGCYYFAARYFDPFTGRFLSPDSKTGTKLNLPTAFNRYAYGMNNPVSFTDPTGHGIWDDLLILGEMASMVLTGGADAEIAVPAITLEVGADITEDATGDIIVDELLDDGSEVADGSGSDSEDFTDDEWDSGSEQDDPNDSDFTSDDMADSSEDESESDSEDDFDREDAVRRGRQGRDNFGQFNQRKTVAANYHGDRTLSGWSAHNGFLQRTNQVLDYGDRMGYDWRRHGFDRGVQGRYYACHAEKQLFMVSHDPMSVSRPMCPDCQQFFRHAAYAERENLIVVQPGQANLFMPDGSMWRSPLNAAGGTTGWIQVFGPLQL